MRNNKPFDWETEYKQRRDEAMIAGTDTTTPEERASRRAYTQSVLQMLERRSHEAN